MPFFKCIFKDLLTNLNVRFWFFFQTRELKTTHLPNETNFVWKKLRQCATIPYFNLRQSVKLDSWAFALIYAKVLVE
jgi:hypothetical protein